MKALLDQVRAGAKLVSPTFPLTQDGNFIAKRDFTTVEGKVINKLVSVNSSGEEDVLTNVRIHDIKQYNDWSIL